MDMPIRRGSIGAQLGQFFFRHILGKFDQCTHYCANVVGRVFISPNTFVAPITYRYVKQYLDDRYFDILCVFQTLNNNSTQHVQNTYRTISTDAINVHSVERISRTAVDLQSIRARTRQLHYSIASFIHL